jgi:adenylate kinase family enzyme
VKRKISIAGNSGSGKTTLSRTVAARLRVPHVELDALFHGPGWIQPDPEEFARRILSAIDGLDGWVVDGNYQGHVGGLVLERAELLVWLDLPLATSLRRLVPRTFRRVRSREDLWGSGNRETLRGAFFGRDSLFGWTIGSHRRRRREWPERFTRYPNLEVLRLRSPREVERWLATVPDAGPPAAAEAHSPSQ